MPWTNRGGGRRYYYRSSRVNGRPTKVYVGYGNQAEAEAAEVETRKAERADRQRTLSAECKAHDEAVAPMDELCRLTDLLMKTHLVLAGYHQHDRGEWRRRRQRDVTGHEPNG